MTAMIRTNAAEIREFDSSFQVRGVREGQAFPASVGSEARVLFDRTVPRSLVHRAAVSEVFLTDLCVTGENTFQVGAQWPRAHSFYSLTTVPRHDPMLFAESLRQATLVLAHQVFDVPMDWKFLSHEKSYQISEGALVLGDRPADILFAVTAREIKRRGGTVSGMITDFDCYRDGERIGSASVRWSCVSPAAYRRVRGGRDVPPPVTGVLPAAVTPQSVGRLSERDVVLSAGADGHSWQVRVDRDHPVLFDHPVDHVPGMVLMEAGRQAAKLVHGRADLLPVGCRFAFERYVELDTPVVVTALPVRSEVPGALGVEAIFDQDGRRVARGHLDMLVRG